MAKRFRGVPPLPTIGLDELGDSVDFRPYDVAAYDRYSLAYVERRRREGTDGLDWRLIRNRPHTTVGSLKKARAKDTKPGNRAPDFRGEKQRSTPVRGRPRLSPAPAE